MARTGQKHAKIFYGWWVVLGAGMGLFVHYGPILAITFGVFFKPLSAEFGWSRTEISLAFSLSTLAMSGALMPLGRLVDVVGARRVILGAALLFGLGVMSFYWLSPVLWHFYALYLLLGIVGSGTTPVPYSKVVSHWFDTQRGLALALAMAGSSLGAFVMPPVAQALIDGVGWRLAYAVLGLLVVGALPIVGLMLKETPQALGLSPDGEPHADPKDAQTSGTAAGLSRREALTSGTFWWMFGAFFLISVSFHACLIHLVPLLTDRGISAQRAAFYLSVVAGGSFTGRLACGYLLDRFFAPHIAVGFFCGIAGGIFLLWSGVVGGLVFVTAALLGLVVGAESDLMAYMVSRYFGLRAFGELFGLIFSAFTLGAVIGPLLMGGSFDATGSYQPALAGLVVLSLVAAGCVMQLGPYRRWETAGEPA